MTAAKFLTLLSPTSELSDHPVGPGRCRWLRDQLRRFVVGIGNKLVVDDSQGMAAERRLKVVIRKSLALVDAKGERARRWEERGV